MINSDMHDRYCGEWGGLCDSLRRQGVDENTIERVIALIARDTLTGILNRRGIEQVFSQQLAIGLRYRRPLAVLLLDLDGFKAVNDREGHPAGDEMLRAFADFLRRAVRGSDVCGRWGGDEFLVVLPETGSEGALNLLDRLRKTAPLPFSAGCACFPGDGEDLVAAADVRLREDKARSR
ncbi:GGDEF domain-containing protein [Kiritimatiella glycovorans]|uniref:diguanylate cyclase n=1 Tax=Kiritimatiella glycovorans TaxID=1307763 RepID=A0A0G3ECJ0_9BACT|nr:GGDEF domain-containing protein [Kiritimatiella glycovorans]AKJ64226.1 Diguanylate cyclase [Kiritimatiella glycovorans]